MQTVLHTTQREPPSLCSRPPQRQESQADVDIDEIEHGLGEGRLGTVHSGSLRHTKQFVGHVDLRKHKRWTAYKYWILMPIPPPPVRKLY